MTKNTLWTFGDSMTFGHACNVNCTTKMKDDYLPYKKEGDDIWPNHLGRFLDYEVKNFGKNGASNDYIFDSIIENFNDIKENDVVVINTTLYGRIEVPIGDYTFSILSSYETTKKVIEGQNNEDYRDKVEAVINYQYHFSNHKFYKERHRKRFQFIKDRLKEDKKLKFVYLWSLEDDDAIYGTFQKIKDDTKGKIDDGHFSFKGHIDFAHYIASMMDSKKLL
jgi:hypothetical protein